MTPVDRATPRQALHDPLKHGREKQNALAAMRKLPFTMQTGVGRKCGKRKQSCQEAGLCSGQTEHEWRVMRRTGTRNTPSPIDGENGCWRGKKGSKMRTTIVTANNKGMAQKKDNRTREERLCSSTPETTPKSVVRGQQKRGPRQNDSVW